MNGYEKDDPPETSAAQMTPPFVSVVSLPSLPRPEHPEAPRFVNVNPFMLMPPPNVLVALLVCKILPPEMVNPDEVAKNPGATKPVYKVEVPAWKLPTPWTERIEPGVVVPMPTRPLFKILKRGELFELVTRKAFVASVEVPVTANLANGDVVPIPTRPVGVMTKRLPLKSPMLLTSMRFCREVGFATPVMARAADPPVLSVLILNLAPRLPEPAT